MKQVYSGAIGARPDFAALAEEIGNPPRYSFIPRYMLSGGTKELFGRQHFLWGMKEVFGGRSLSNPLEIENLSWGAFADSSNGDGNGSFPDPIRRGVDSGNNLVGLYFAELDGILRGSVSVVSKATTYMGEYFVALSKPEAIPLTAQEKKKIQVIDVFLGPKVSNSRKAFDELPVEERERLLTALLASSAEGAVIEDIVPMGSVAGYQEALQAAEQYRVPLSEVGQRFRKLEIELTELKTAYKTTFPDITVFNGTPPEHIKGCLPFELKSRTDRVLVRLGSEAFYRNLRRQQLAAPALL